MEGRPQEGVAAGAGMSVRTARKWAKGPLPWESTGTRTWRTRPDPFVEGPGLTSPSHGLCASWTTSIVGVNRQQ